MRKKHVKSLRTLDNSRILDYISDDSKKAMTKTVGFAERHREPEHGGIRHQYAGTEYHF